MWYLTHDMSHVTDGGRWTFSQNFGSLALTVWEWHVAPDTWHMTHDTWHVTCEMWHMKCNWWLTVNILLKCQVPSSYTLGMKVFWIFGTKGWLTHLIIECQMCFQNNPGYTRSVKHMYTVRRRWLNQILFVQQSTKWLSPDSSCLGSCGAVVEDIAGGLTSSPHGWRQCTDLFSPGASYLEHKHTAETVLQPSWHSGRLLVFIHTTKTPYPGDTESLDVRG